MVGVAVYWSVHPWVTTHKSGPNRWLNLYGYVIREFGATDFFLIGDQLPIYEKVEFTVHKSDNLTQVLSNYQDVRIVVLDKTGKAMPLRNYEHPPGDVIYLIGNDFGEIEYEKLEPFLDRCDFVRIETQEPVLKLMWSPTVLSIVLYDRYVKGK